MTNHSRYPGIRPFETADKDVFFGRDEDIRALSLEIKLNKTTVLFGKSGYGKSSLINAGLIPHLVSLTNIIPLQMRFGAFMQHQSSDLIGQVSMSIREKNNLVENPIIEKVEHFLGQPTLWQWFKHLQITRQNPTNETFLLIFDQSEEVFTYPQHWQDALWKQLADLIYGNIPQEIIENFEQVTSDERDILINDNMDVRLLFSLRSDKLALLSRISMILPQILTRTYELKALSMAQAREAIQEPAMIIESFATLPFTYTEKAIGKILNSLNGTETVTNSGEDAKIEAFQLQILCEHMESEVRSGKIADIDGDGFPDITEDNLPEMFSLYDSYYHRKLDELDPSVKEAARQILEDGLLVEDGRTGEGRRLSVDSRALLAQFGKIGLNDALLKSLADTLLIRSEWNVLGGLSYEISHDTLIAPIQKAKSERKHKEREIEIVIRQKELAEATQQAEAEKKRRKRATLLSGLAIIGFVLALLGMFWALKNQKAAQYAKMQAESTMAQLIKIQNEKEKIEVLLTLEKGESFLKADICPPPKYIEQINDMKKKYPNDDELQKQIKDFWDKYQLSNCH
jgi:nitrogen fixation-related uncharacterized protein